MCGFDTSVVSVLTALHIPHVLPTYLTLAAPIRKTQLTELLPSLDHLLYAQSFSGLTAVVWDGQGWQVQSRPKCVKVGMVMTSSQSRRKLSNIKVDGVLKVNFPSWSPANGELLFFVRVNSKCHRKYHASTKKSKEKRVERNK